MWVCAGCLRASGDERPEASCSVCGSQGWARVKRDTVLEFTADAGAPCSECGAYGLDLKFRAFRRVVGLLILDRIHIAAGYFCRQCKWRVFGRMQALTLILGWWGVLAMLFRNPFALVANTRALFASPVAADELGALTLADYENTLALEGQLVPAEPDDTWVCEACGEHFAGYERAYAHADSGHPELRFEDAKAALSRLGTSSDPELP
jgi:hypothetical protein